MSETNAPRSISEPQIKNNGDTAYATPFGMPTYQELAARIESMQKREAMLVDTLLEIKKASGYSADLVKSPVSVFTDMATIHQLSDSTLSATAFDTESWLQAEIVKWRGEPRAWIRHHVNDRPDDFNVHIDWNKADAERWLSQYMNGFAWLEPLYRLPEPLATPEERKE